MANEIDDIAASWVARRDATGLSPTETAELASWLKQDRRHAGAFARARALFTWADRAQADAAESKVPAPQAQSETPTIRRDRRRQSLLALAAAVAASVVLGLLSYAQLQSYDRFSTAQGEVRRLNLRDGSTMTLNTASEARVSWSGAMRRVQLLEGEALFDVAPDADRPFIVETRVASVRAVGTSFSVRRVDADRIEVMVREGIVEVDSHHAADSPPTALRANMRATDIAGQQPRVEQLDPDQVAQHLSWREGMIAFDGDTLAEAAREFARYSPTPLLIEDEQVAQMRIVGLFASNDPAGFARAAALSLGLETQTDARGVRIGLRRGAH
jgi:transmembrane sensor